MIIFGTNYRYRTNKTGQFECPTCRQQAKYELKTGRRYGTLYFIPVLPIGPEEQVVVCQNCGAHLPVSVLSEKSGKAMKPVTLAEMLNQLESTLRYGRPIEYVLSDLRQAGLEHAEARRIVNSHIGEARAQCSQCGLSYADNVSSCAECGRALEAF